MGARRFAFYAVVVVFVGLLGGIGREVLVLLFTGWFQAEELGIHQLHELVIAATLWSVLIGILAQLHRPEHKVGALQQSALVLLAIFLGRALGGDFTPPLVIFLTLIAIAGVLHPARDDLLRPRASGVTPWTIGLVLVAAAAVPLLLFASEQIMLQRIGGGEHAVLGHWGTVAGLAVAILALGTLASLRPTGWWIPAWSAGGLAAVYGLASVLFPAQASSAGMTWGLLAILWGVTFVGTAELTQDQEAATPLGQWRANRGAGAS